MFHPWRALATWRRCWWHAAVQSPNYIVQAVYNSDADASGLFGQISRSGFLKNISPRGWLAVLVDIMTIHVMTELVEHVFILKSYLEMYVHCMSQAPGT